MEIACALLDSRQVDVNKKNNEGMNALMLAAQRGHAHVVSCLIKAGASADEQTAQGSTALMLACKRGNEAAVETLVQLGAEIYMRDCRGRTARDICVKRQHPALMAAMDTARQVRHFAAEAHAERQELLRRLRAAANDNRLVLADGHATVRAMMAAAGARTGAPCE